MLINGINRKTGIAIIDEKSGKPIRWHRKHLIKNIPEKGYSMVDIASGVVLLNDSQRKAIRDANKVIK